MDVAQKAPDWDPYAAGQRVRRVWKDHALIRTVRRRTLLHRVAGDDGRTRGSALTGPMIGHRRRDDGGGRFHPPCHSSAALYRRTVRCWWVRPTSLSRCPRRAYGRTAAWPLRPPHIRTNHTTPLRTTAWSTAAVHRAAACYSSQSSGASRVEVAQCSGVRAEEADVQAVWSLTRSSITRHPVRLRRDEAGAALYLQSPPGIRRRCATEGRGCSCCCWVWMFTHRPVAVEVMVLTLNG